MWVWLLLGIGPVFCSPDCMLMPLNSLFTRTTDSIINIDVPGSSSWLGVLFINVLPALLVVSITLTQWCMTRHRLTIEYRSNRTMLLIVTIVVSSIVVALLMWHTFDLVGASRCLLLSNVTFLNSGDCENALTLSGNVLPWRPLALIGVCVLAMLPTLNACLRIRVWAMCAILLAIASAAIAVLAFLLKYECGRHEACPYTTSICTSTAPTAISVLLATHGLISLLFPVFKSRCNVGRSSLPCATRNIQMPIDPTFKSTTNVYIPTTADRWTMA